MIREHQYTVYVVRCDLCGHQNRSVADAFGTSWQAYKDAVAHGWSINEHDDGTPHDLCPSCAITAEPCS